MNRGLIVEVNTKYSVVLTDDMRYVKIKNMGKMKRGMAVSFTENDLYAERNYHWNVLVAACLVLVMVMGIPMVTLDSLVETYAVVSLDINPSFQFEVDAEYHVMEMTALNEDAEGLMVDEWVGKPLKLVLSDVIKRAADAEYLTEERDVVMMSYASDHDVAELEEIIESVSESDDINFIIIASDLETVEAAKKENVSVGRKALANEIDEDAETMDLTEVKEKVQAIHNNNLTRWIDNKARVEQMKQEKKRIKDKDGEEEDSEHNGNKPDVPPGLENKTDISPGKGRKSDVNLPPGREKKIEIEESSTIEQVAEEDINDNDSEHIPPGQAKKGEGNISPGHAKEYENSRNTSNDDDLDSGTKKHERSRNTSSDDELDREQDGGSTK